MNDQCLKPRIHIFQYNSYLHIDELPKHNIAAIAASTAEPFLVKISFPILLHCSLSVAMAACSNIVSLVCSFVFTILNKDDEKVEWKLISKTNTIDLEIFTRQNRHSFVGPY